MNTHKANTYSPLALAYIGDGVYELFIRTYVLSRGNMPVNKMHKASRELVRATAQAKLYHLIENMLTEEELQVLKRGRNAKSISAPKNADITEYRHATGVEALIGYLYLEGRIDRINEIIEIGLNAL
ncbi:MAG: ribonuclease III domain-containing protein [Clostridiales bacterium]|nr:ribonuclease III domain-containing protein [Clostridiales bacterium]MDU6974446.1 ribonuclease III domain-containing protein [Clostridiales bacterium]